MAASPAHARRSRLIQEHVMPNSATQLYHKNPDLQVVLEFLGRCVPDGQRMVARYKDAHERAAVKDACAVSGIHPANTIFLGEPGVADPVKENAQHGLALEREDWLALAENAMSLLAQALRLRLPAINAALKLVPVNWDTLMLPDSALSAWGISARMVALPARTVFDYFGSRYPSGAAQRGKYAIVRDVEHAAVYKENHAPGFLFDQGGVQNFACNVDDWQREVTSARALINDHLSLMLKIGLQMLEAGASGHLKEWHPVLALAAEAPSLTRLQTLLETYEDHVASYGAGQNRFRSKLLQHCLDEFVQWRTKCGLDDRKAPGVAHAESPVVDRKEWKWTDEGAAMVAPVPAMSPAATSTVPTADPVIADGVVIPHGVTVARGAHVRVCTITPETRLKPGTVLHGDVSIASHTRFDGPLTIMHDVRIGRGLTFSPGLILTEGATISSFTVKSLLPRGTCIGGSLRIGESSTVGSNVSFGAENWIGERVHIGKNVRFGPYVRVDNDIAIGANAWIKGHTRLIGDVPENAEVEAHAAGAKSVGQAQAGPAYAIGISPFIITKNEAVRERPATLRRPLAWELDREDAGHEDRPHRAVEEAGTPDRPSAKKLPMRHGRPRPQALQRHTVPAPGRIRWTRRIHRLPSARTGSSRTVPPAHLPSFPARQAVCNASAVETPWPGAAQSDFARTWNCATRTRNASALR
jgi:acetyltransferase-like isoleucine patch superfamily enzyme